MRKYINFLVNQFKAYILRDEFLLSAKKWFKDNGDNTLRLEYPLNEDSIVFDVGGYKGEFANKIFEKYKCNVYVFEPVSTFYEKICEKFKYNPKIKVFNFGLSDVDEKLDISISDDASSVHTDLDSKEDIKLRSVNEFVLENKVKYIDLMKINVEGGEFQILPALIDSAYIKNIGNLQIQFHNFIPKAEEMRESIRKQLANTHRLTYDYYFIWENWELK